MTTSEGLAPERFKEEMSPLTHFLASHPPLPLHLPFPSLPSPCLSLSTSPTHSLFPPPFLPVSLSFLSLPGLSPHLTLSLYHFLSFSPSPPLSTCPSIPFSLYPWVYLSTS